MMAMPTRTDGDDGDRGFSHATDCLDALPLKIEQQVLQGEGQTSEQWRQDNRQAVERYNERVTTHGVFSDGVRCF